MLTIYIDADACPVKDEVYRVADRYGLGVAVVANAPLRIPANASIQFLIGIPPSRSLKDEKESIRDQRKWRPSCRAVDA